MTQATPEYDIGDRVEIAGRKIEGEISSRWYDEANESWIYRVYDSDRNIGVYQEKHLKQ